MSVKVEVDAGVCGFHTCVRAASEDGQNVSFDIASGCEKIRGLAGALRAKGPVDAYQEISAEGQSVVMATVRENLKGCCAGCAVPVGIFKGMQVAAGLALPKDISLQIVAE
jgi:hypothetical protein